MSNELNDPAKWIMKGQTAIKHQVLEHYLKAYGIILTRGNNTGLRTSLHYIDGFGGRGVYEGGEPGSPIIAMKVADMLANDSGGKAVLKVHAIELDSENHASLDECIRATKAECPGAVVDLRHGSFVENIDEIMGSLGEYEHAFVFIDPFGYRDAIEIATVAKLIARPRTEVFVTFMSHNINRYIGDKTKTKDERMAQIFGKVRLEQLQERKDRQELLARLYGEAVQEQASALGVHNVLVYSTGVKFDDRAQNIYHLIHLSRDPKARLEMEKAVKRTNILVGAPPLMVEWERPQIEQVVIDYLSRKPGKRASGRDVAGAMWRTYWNLTWLGEVRQILLGLEASGVIQITRPGAKTRKAGQAIDEKDVVQLKV